MIPIQGTIDPEAIERELHRLWLQTSQAGLREVKPGDERATIRARAANLLVYLADEAAANEVNEALAALSGRHPCRALVMIGSEQAADRDIEMFVASFCQPVGRKTDRKLCCEQVTLSARGRFVAELPSVAIPLLVPDLPVFLWWRAELRPGDQSLAKLARRADRVIIDSADFKDLRSEMSTLVSLMSPENEADANQANYGAISDLNWARITLWRATLAGFFDLPQNRITLDQIVNVTIDYADGEVAESPMPAQPLLFTGWLTSRLGWKITQPGEPAPAKPDRRVGFTRDGQEISVEFRPVERGQLLPGRLARVVLATDAEVPVSFAVGRSQDGCYLEATMSDGKAITRSRVSPTRTREAAELLAGEMEILCRDRVYEEAIWQAAQMFV